MMRFVDRDGLAVIDLPNSLATRMRMLACRSQTRETGGILIGRYDDAHHTALVHSVTGPPRDSVRAPTTFRRGVYGLDALLSHSWKRGLYYLGEWHYHPEPTPRASWTDELQMAQFARAPAMHCPEPILLIVGLPECGGAIVGHVFRVGLVELNLAPSAEQASTQ